MTQRAAKDIIRDGIDALGVSQKDFARSLGVDASTVTKWVKGNQHPRRFLVPLLAEKLGVDELELHRAISAEQDEENRDLRREAARHDGNMAEMRKIVEANRDINEQIGRDIAAMRAELRDFLKAIIDLVEGKRPGRP